MTLLLALVALAGDWAQLNQSALASLAQGKFVDAERLAKAAVDAGASDAERAAAYVNLGRVYRDWARCEPAAKATERGVQLFAKGPDRLLAMEAASQLTSVFLECGALERAREIDKRYVDLALARRELPPARLAQLLGNSGVIALLRKRHSEAEALLREAVGLARPIDQAVIHGSLAALFMETKRPKLALESAQESLKLVEAEMGLTHPLALRMLANLSAIHERLGHSGQADEYHERAMAMLDRYYGAEHPLGADVLLNRAQALRARHRTQEARLLEQRAQSIMGAIRSAPLDHTVGLLEIKPLR